MDGTCPTLRGKDLQLELEGVFLVGCDGIAMVFGPVLLHVVVFGLLPALLDIEGGGDPTKPPVDDGNRLLEGNCCPAVDNLAFTPKDICVCPAAGTHSWILFCC